MSDETILVLVNIGVMFFVILGARWLKRFFASAESESKATVRNSKLRVCKKRTLVLDEFVTANGIPFLHVFEKFKFVCQVRSSLADLDKEELVINTLAALHSSLCMVDEVTLEFMSGDKKLFTARVVAPARGEFPKNIF